MTTINKHNVATVVLATVTGTAAGGFKAATGENMVQNGIQAGVAGVVSGLIQHFVVNKRTDNNMVKYGAAIGVGLAVGGATHGGAMLVNKFGMSQEEAEAIVEEIGLE